METTKTEQAQANIIGEPNITPTPRANSYGIFEPNTSIVTVHLTSEMVIALHQKYNIPYSLNSKNKSVLCGKVIEREFFINTLKLPNAHVTQEVVKAVQQETTKETAVADNSDSELVTRLVQQVTAQAKEHKKTLAEIKTNAIAYIDGEKVATATKNKAKAILYPQVAPTPEIKAFKL